MTDTRQSNIEESIATENERDELRAEVERLRDELGKIDRLPVKWVAPLYHAAGDAGERAWAAVGSEAHLIAHRALGGTLQSARALIDASYPDEPRYATAEEPRYDADVDRLAALTRRLDQQRAILMRHETRLADLERPSGAQPFDPKYPPGAMVADMVRNAPGNPFPDEPSAGFRPFDPKVHSDKRGTVIGR